MGYLPLGLVIGVYLLYFRDTISNVPFAKEINFASSYFGISAKLINAIVRVESNYDPFAIGSIGERGLMQLTQGAWSDSIRWNGLENWNYSLATNPKINIIVGTGYLKYLRDTCTTNLNDLIRSYNAGCAGAKLGRGNDYLEKVKRYL